MPDQCSCGECRADESDTPLADRLHHHAEELARLERTVGTDDIDVTLHGAGAMHVDITYPGLKSDD